MSGYELLSDQGKLFFSYWIGLFKQYLVIFYLIILQEMRFSKNIGYYEEGG